jgi:hypothetical protein
MRSSSLGFRKPNEKKRSEGDIKKKMMQEVNKTGFCTFLFGDTKNNY